MKKKVYRVRTQYIFDGVFDVVAESKEDARQKALEDEACFLKLKAPFFGIAFTDGLIEVRALESVQAYMDEGKAMHHCVFDCSYHLKAESLILSATIEGKRIETIEVSLKTLEVVQSRGICNQNTPYHERIISLVSQNIGQIQARIA